MSGLRDITRGCIKGDDVLEGKEMHPECTLPNGHKGTGDELGLQVGIWEGEVSCLHSLSPVTSEVLARAKAEWMVMAAVFSMTFSPT